MSDLRFRNRSPHWHELNGGFRHQFAPQKVGRGDRQPRPTSDQAASVPPGLAGYWLGAIACSHDTFGFMSAKVPVGLPFQAQTCSS